MKPRYPVLGIGASLGFRAAIIVVLLCGGYLVFEFGRLQANYNIVDAIQEKQALSETIQELEDQVVVQKQQIILLESKRKIDKEAYALVEEGFSKLRSKIQEQWEVIAFYRGILSHEDDGHGLRVKDLRLTRGSGARHYNIRLVLMQLMPHDRSVMGEVDLTLDGAQDGVEATYNFEQLVPEDGNSNWLFAFKYFQDFERELVLPEGFKPEKVNIQVISRTKSIASVKQSFDWLAGSG